jgi:hypothetical protein
MTTETKSFDPQELLDAAFSMIPTFRLYWQSPDNVFINSDGSYSHCSVFAQLSHYLPEHISDLKGPDLSTLFNFVETCIVNKQEGLSNAACTCFLENLASEGALSQTISPYLGKRSKEYFANWNR